MKRQDRGWLGIRLCNLSMLLYIVWLMLPVVQTSLHAVTGAATVVLFGVGVLLDGETFPKRLPAFLLRVLFVAGLPLVLFFVMERGGGNLPAYYAQQGMFWFPVLWCAYARERADARLYRWIKPVLIAALVLTTLTTLGWLVQGLLRGGKVYAYARSLGSGEPGREAYLKELMLRNIGGYDFIYASVLALPITAYLISQTRGLRRAGITTFYLLQLMMIGISQYTYAIVFALVITAMELVALILRRIWRNVSLGASLLWTVPLLLCIWFLRVPFTQWAANIATGIGFQNAAYSLNQLLVMFTGGTVDAGSRLAAYTIPLQGFLDSPLIGSLAGGVKQLGMHSDLLDMLSTIGLLGTAGFVCGVWIIGRGSEKGLRTPALPQLVLQRNVMLACLILGTVFYSREMTLVLCLTTALMVQPLAKGQPQIPTQGQTKPEGMQPR